MTPPDWGPVDELILDPGEKDQEKKGDANFRRGRIRKKSSVREKSLGMKGS